ncbi:MAG: carboxypeptidase-like regulatory domain-containing protein [Planctomycetes bacterium]|nr:carboxypeptidase-like regulatory domain-containing protein [Planctomycetota bacterium]
MATEPTAEVRGRVVRQTDGAPVSGAVVSIVTGRPEIEYSQVREQVESGEESPRFHREAAFEQLRRDGGGWRHAFRTTTSEDGTFALSVPASLPPFRFEAWSEEGSLDASGERVALGLPEVEAGVPLVLEPAGGIRGRILSPTGTPVHDARVFVQPHFANPSGIARGGSATTDGEGRFSLFGLPPGPCTAAAAAEGFGVAVRADLEVVAGGVARIEVRLPLESFLEGRVLGPDGRGVPGASVMAEPQPVPQKRSPDGAWIDESVRSSPYRLIAYEPVVTDRRGRFRMGSLSPGPHEIRVEKAGLAPSEPIQVDLPAAGGVRDLRFDLERGLSVSGRVLDVAGRPVPGAHVGAWWFGPGRSVGQSGRSLADGSFTLAGLGSDTVDLYAGERTKGLARIRNLAAGARDLELRLGGTFVLSGRVLDAEARSPVRAFSVQARRFDWIRGEDDWVVYDQPFASAEGRFELRDPPPGSYEILVRAPGFFPQTIRGLQVFFAGDTPSIEVGLGRGATLSGRVVAKETGTPVEGAILTLQAHDPPTDAAWRETARLCEARSGRWGTFEIRGVPAGNWSVSARRLGFVQDASEPFDLKGSGPPREVVVALSPTGGIEGIALDEEGKPLSGARVAVTPLAWDRRRPFGPPKTALTDDEGRYRVLDLVPNQYLVSIEPRADSAGGRGTVVLRGREAVGPGEVRRVAMRAIRRTTVRGRVSWCAEGAEGVLVRIQPERGPSDAIEKEDLPRDLPGKTGPDGSFSVAGIPIGEAELRVETASGTFTRKVRLPDAAETWIDFPLPLGGLEGRVLRGRGGEPVAGAEVQLQGPVTHRSKTDERGRYAFRLLQPGTYGVRVLGKDAVGSAPALVALSIVE